MRPETRQRLVEMRSGLLADMDRQIEAGQLALLAGINAALGAIDGEAVPADPAARVVVSDDGQIRLTLYRDDGAAFATPIAPGRAVALAGELIAAALPKLAR
jgi:hypothetical protein